MRRNTRDDEEYRSYITASFDRWARLYDHTHQVKR